MIILTRKQLLAVAALAVALVAVVLGLAYRNDLRAWAAPQKPATGEPAGHDMATMEEPKERKVLYWYDPMHPAYKSDKPGVAPDCGMQLVPKYADAAASMRTMPAGAVQISPAKQQLIGVRTATVAAEDLTQIIRAVGLVQVDETRVARVHTKVSGWVRRVFVDYTWEHVERGAPPFPPPNPPPGSAPKGDPLSPPAPGDPGPAPHPG